MTTTRSSFFISGAVIALIITAPLVALAAWSEPTQAPTGGNTDPPINTGSQNQNKNGGLSVTGFAVFGNTSLNGNTYLKTGVTGSVYRYLNFGADYDVNGNVIATTIGESGYGIRDKDGTLEFKNSGGSWQSIQAILWELCGGPCGGEPTQDQHVSFLVDKGGTNQSVPVNTITKLTWSNEVFDTNNNFANNRFTPTVAGKYIINASFHCNSGGTWCQVYIYKNGTNVASNFDRTSVDTSVSATTIVDMNGSTDYIEVYGRNGGGASINGDTTLTQFSGALL